MRKIRPFSFLILIVLLFFNCASIKNADNSYILKTRYGTIGHSEELSSTTLFYLNNVDKKSLDSFMLNSSRGIIETNRDLIKKFKAIPIFEEPVRLWNASCVKKKLSLSKDFESKNDTVIYKNILTKLKRDSGYTQILNERFKHYKIYFYFRKVKNIEFCKVESTFSYSDSCIIIKKLRW